MKNMGLIGQLLKSPSQVRKEEQEALRQKGLQRAALVRGSGGAGASLFGGMFTDFAAQQAADLDKRIQQGVKGLGGLAGADMRSGAEKQAVAQQQAVKGMQTNDPVDLRKRAELLENAGNTQAAMQLREKADQIEASRAASESAAAQQAFENRIKEGELAVQQGTLAVAQAREKRLGSNKELSLSERYFPVGKHVFDVLESKYLPAPDGGKTNTQYLKVTGEDGQTYHQAYDDSGNPVGEPILAEQPELSATVEKMVDTAMTEVQETSARVTNISALRQELQSNPFRGGAAKTGGAMIKSYLGGRDEDSYRQTALKAISNEKMLRNLPPGPATDKDVEEAKKTVPPENASSAEWVDWLTKYEAIERKALDYQRFKASYLSAKGSQKGISQAWAKREETRMGQELLNMEEELQSLLGEG